MVGYGAQLEKLQQHFWRQNIILETPANLANFKGQSLFMMQLKNLLVKILMWYLLSMQSEASLKIEDPFSRDRLRSIINLYVCVLFFLCKGIIHKHKIKQKQVKAKALRSGDPKSRNRGTPEPRKMTPNPKTRNHGKWPQILKHGITENDPKS